MSIPGSRSFWLLARPGVRERVALTTRLCEGEIALPVFSFEDEARMFLDFGVARDGWQVRETKAEELVSMLLGPCADVETVLLDPLPGLDIRSVADLVGVTREAFVDRQLNRRWRPNVSRKGSFEVTARFERTLVRF